MEVEEVEEEEDTVAATVIIETGRSSREAADKEI